MEAQDERSNGSHGPGPLVLVSPDELHRQELALTGLLLLHTDLRPRALDGLGPLRFSHRTARAVWAVLSGAPSADLAEVAFRVYKESGGVTAADVSDLADGVLIRPSAEGLDEMCRRIRQAWAATAAKEQAAGLVRAIEAGADVRTYLDGIDAEIDRSSGCSRFREAILTGRQLFEIDLPEPPSLLGDRVITSVDYAVLYGRPGLGKSFLAFQLAAAVAHGWHFMGLSTTQGRAAILSLEVSAYFSRERLRPLIEGHPTDDLDVLTCDRMRGLIDLADATDQRELTALIRDRDLSLLVIDPLAVAFRGKEDREDLAPVIRWLKEVPVRTGCVPLLVHHEPKPAQGVQITDDLAALRGASQLGDLAGTLMRLKRDKGHLLLTWPKTRNAPHKPEDLYLYQSADGLLTSMEAPKDRVELAAERDDRMVEMVRDHPGITATEIASQVGISRQQVTKRLGALESVRLVGRGVDACWHPND